MGNGLAVGAREERPIDGRLSVIRPLTEDVAQGNGQLSSVVKQKSTDKSTTIGKTVTIGNQTNTYIPEKRLDMMNEKAG